MPDRVLKSEPEPTREFPIIVTVDGRVKVDHRFLLKAAVLVAAKE